MAASLVVAPEYPFPSQQCSITFTGLHGSTNQIELFPLSAPVGSAIRGKLDAARGKRVSEYAGASGTPWIFTPDVGGVYTFTLQETTISPATGNRFDGDTRGAPEPTITQTGTVVLYVGQKLELRLGQQPDQATLRLWVWNNTCRATTVAVHGEDTPALYDPTSPAAENATENATLIAAVSALAGATSTTILGSFADEFVNVNTSYALHHLDGAIHEAADDVNAVGDTWRANDPVAASKAIQTLWQALGAHTRQLFDSDTETPGTVHSAVDGTSSYLTSGATRSRADQYLTLADIIVRLEEHKDVTSIHDTADPYGEPSYGPLLAVHVAWIRALKVAPTYPAEKNQAAALLTDLGGFTEA